MKKIKILAVASGGGHLIQLMRMAPAFNRHQVTYVSTINWFNDDKNINNSYLVKDASRTDKMALLVLVLQIIRIIIRLRPKLVITTGAAPGILAIIIGKLVGAKTIWVDSIANAEDLSLSGKLALRFSDLCITQWEDVSKKYAKLKYYGSVF